MKRILFAFALILFTASIASAQEKKAIIAVEGGETVHDFGDIKVSDGAVTHVFTIKNEGNIPLTINNATASCGCTKPEYTEAPIAPGKTGELKVTYSPSGSGPVTKTISVYSNGKTGTYVLHIKANIVN